eukprot:171825_1
MPMGRLCFSLVVIWIISGGQCALDSNHIDILTSETNQWLVDNPTINPSSEDEGNVSASIILDSDEEISDDYQDFTGSLAIRIIGETWLHGAYLALTRLLCHV